MENEVAQIWNWLHGSIALSTTGFFFLAGWLIKIEKSIARKVEQQWLEEKFERDIKRELSLLNSVLSEIKSALVGDLNSEGMRTKLSRHESQMFDFEKRMKSIESKHGS